MKIESEMLSAFLDGALSPAQTEAVEAALAADPALQAQLEALMAGDALAQEAFAEMLDEPVPIGLAAAVKNAEVAAPANVPAAPARGRALAAGLAALALMVGSVGGYVVGTSSPGTVVASRGWLEDIADYHRVYSAQARHLVEVGAEEADHIEAWLTGTVGAPVRIPDLSRHGLTFEGGRLLVAAGKPVAQLIFTDASNRVVALCVIQSETPAQAPAQRNIGGFDMVSWGGEGANLVIVGDEGRADLDAIAETAAQEA